MAAYVGSVFFAQIPKDGLAVRVTRHEPREYRFGEPRRPQGFFHVIFPITDSRPCQRRTIASFSLFKALTPRVVTL